MLDAYDRYLVHLLSIIDAHGWAVQHVGASECPPEPSFAYTVGLTAFGHPEFLVFGLSRDTARDILNAFGEEVRDGKVFTPNPAVSGILTGDHRLALIHAVDTSDLIMAHNLFPEVDALQILWPDPEDRLPWEDGFDHDQWPQPQRGLIPASFLAQRSTRSVKPPRSRGARSA